MPNNLHTKKITELDRLEAALSSRSGPRAGGALPSTSRAISSKWRAKEPAIPRLRLISPDAPPLHPRGRPDRNERVRPAAASTGPRPGRPPCHALTQPPLRANRPAKFAGAHLVTPILRCPKNRPATLIVD
ncbi:hypothetical protein NL676_013260 [Syzygium grande]|nr:hypothetical protein NL676_013260 [Syzygium grande]